MADVQRGRRREMRLDIMGARSRMPLNANVDFI